MPEFLTGNLQVKLKCPLFSSISLQSFELREFNQKLLVSGAKAHKLN